MFIIVVAISVAALILAITHLAGFTFPDKWESRKEAYRRYLESEAWQRKRYVVLRRDNWRCIRCGAKATQVHHMRYAKYNIGKEPIEWLVSVCKTCHESEHRKPITNDDWWGSYEARVARRMLFGPRRRWWR